VTAFPRCLCVSSVLFWAGAASAAPIASFDDIKFWVGTGANRAALVIDWQDGTSPALAWGYRWDGSATGEAMVNAIALADPRLEVETVLYSIGPAVVGWRYGTAYRNGFEPGDPGYWGYYLAEGDGHSPGSPGTSAWSFASEGYGTRVLSNGSWDGWSYQPNFAGTAPSAAVFAAEPVPEPASLLAVAALGAGVVVMLRRRSAGRRSAA
jgi:hypothetical protein